MKEASYVAAMYSTQLYLVHITGRSIDTNTVQIAVSYCNIVKSVYLFIQKKLLYNLVDSVNLTTGGKNNVKCVNINDNNI